ncbi:hypothetical protein ACHAXN_012779 [Cyclotella atomus]
MYGAAFKLQQCRRDQERLIHEKQSYLHQQHDTKRLLDWENRTNAQIQQREINNLTQKLLKEDEDELKKRQQELKTLYGVEMDRWKTEVRDKLEVTTEQRMEQIRERAYALKAKREAERQEFVKECYQRQWRDANDDLRAIDSKATLDRLAQDRKLMLESKKALMERQKAEEVAVGDSMTFLQDRDDDDDNHRRETNMRALDQQLKWKREHQAALLEQKKREEEEQLRHLAHLEEKSKEAHNQLLRKAKKEGDDMYQQMLQRSKQREERKKIESDRDLILLQHALEKERHQIEVERAKKEEGKEAAFEYVHCLREQLKEEAAEKRATNAIRDEASEKIFAKNDARLAAEAKRRKQWMEEVKLSRQEQIRLKQQEIKRLREEEELDVLEFRASQLRQEEEERQRQEQAKQEVIQNMLANKAIMEKMARDRDAEKSEKFLLKKDIEYAERLHRQKLEIHKCAG